MPKRIPINGIVERNNYPIETLYANPPDFFLSFDSKIIMKKIFPFLLLLQLTGYGQVASEIYMFNLGWKNNEPVLSSPVNITNHKGYDNQPFFHPSKPLIYYSSFNDSGRSDINYYNYLTKQTVQFTNTLEREYSPTLTPDRKFISCIIQREQGAQDLGKYPVKGGKPETIIQTLKVGYHLWIDDQHLLLFVLGDSNQNYLHYFNLITKEDKVIADNPRGVPCTKFPDRIVSVL